MPAAQLRSPLAQGGRTPRLAPPGLRAHPSERPLGPPGLAPQPPPQHGWAGQPGGGHRADHFLFLLSCPPPTSPSPPPAGLASGLWVMVPPPSHCPLFLLEILLPAFPWGLQTVPCCSPRPHQQFLGWCPTVPTNPWVEPLGGSTGDPRAVWEGVRCPKATQTQEAGQWAGWGLRLQLDSPEMQAFRPL